MHIVIPECKRAGVCVCVCCVTNRHLRHVQPLLGVILSRQEGDEVKCGEARLATAGHEDERGLGRRVGSDGCGGRNT